GGAGVENVDDVRMPDARRRARLGAEARHHFALPRVDGVEHLDGDAAADLGVLGLVDQAHAAFADEPPGEVLAGDGRADDAVAPRRCRTRRWAVRHRVRLRLELRRRLLFSLLRLGPAGRLVEQLLPRLTVFFDLAGEQRLQEAGDARLVRRRRRLRQKAGQRRA